jgi:hypothetical protein
MRIGLLLVLATVSWAMLSAAASAQQAASRAGTTFISESSKGSLPAPPPLDDSMFELPPLVGPENHPLMPALRRAYEGMERMKQIRDYTCTLIKRERVNGELLPPEYIELKIRHQPFGAYLYFRAPTEKRGREALYVPTENRGRIVGNAPNIGTVTLDPNSRRAMEDNRYPIYEIGMANLIRRLVEVGLAEMQYGECEVQFFENSKINGRVCTCMQFVHPVPRQEFRYHIARVFIDEENQIPIRYEAYTWPKEKGGKPVLVEEYTYLDVKLNVGLTDRDFSVSNPDYGFRGRMQDAD